MQATRLSFSANFLPKYLKGLQFFVRYFSTIDDSCIYYFSAEDERAMRRESYLKATEGGRMHIDSDLSDSGDISPQVLRR